MKIEISDDTAISIIADVMVYDYLRLQADIERYEDKPILSNVEKADLDNWKKAIQAIDITLDYYLGYEWKNRYVG